MTFDQFWQTLKDKNPGLADSDTRMTITVASFRKSLEQSYERGRDQERMTGPQKTYADSLFGKLFG